MTRVVLGSASTGRRRVLRSAGIDPLIAVSGVDEDAAIAALGAHPDPATVVTTLARAKADAVARELDAEVTVDCVVIGCDSMLYVNGELVASTDMPFSVLRMFGTQGLTCGYDGGEPAAPEEYVGVTTVRFGVPTEDELAAYIASGEPLNVAGGFTIDGLGGWFIDAVEGDPSNVVGLGLSVTRRLLESVGLSVGDLWRANPVR